MTLNRQEKIEQYGRAYDDLVAALARFPQEMWQFRPSPNEWTIHEIIIHITDSEANSYARCRRAIAEPGNSVMAYSETDWAQALHYHEQSIDDALMLFKWLRANTYKLVRRLPETAWSHTIKHPENSIMTLDDWLDVYALHVTQHIEQMEHVVSQWRLMRVDMHA